MQTKAPIRLVAPAKLNLALHVQDKRSDGYHELQSLVTFTEFGDVLTFEEAENVTLTVTGPFAPQAGASEGNLVLRAAAALQKITNGSFGVHITLEKNIPVGAGLGGGSADAATTLKALRSFWGVAVSDAALHGIALTLGADVPVCLLEKTTLVSGIGEVFAPLNIPMEHCHVVLVYPNSLLPTACVFSVLTSADYCAANIAKHLQTQGFWDGLKACRNSLQAAAISQCAEVASVLIELETSVCQPDLVRMTGSGSCCFALFDTRDRAADLVSDLQKRHPDWWVQLTSINQ